MNRPPNILWYCTDQQRFDTIGALGNPHVQTPRLDRFVEEGVALTHAFCQSPICTPSRSSFLTGQYPARLRSTRNGNAHFDHAPPLISQLLAEVGYRCGNVGKFHLQSSGQRTEPRMKDDGYSFWRFSHAPRDDWKEGHDYADWVRANGGDLDALRARPEGVPTELHQTTWATEASIEFLREQETTPDQPWMLTINPYDPHPPFVPPKSYSDRFDPEDMPGPIFEPGDLEEERRLLELGIDFQGEPDTPDAHGAKAAQARYYAMIAQIDDQFSRLLEYLDQCGQAENTIVVFTSDHGETLGDHGLMAKGCRFYEGLVRVPLLIRWPGTAQPGLLSDALVELLDINATLLEAAGVDLPDHHQGQSLVPLLRGEADAHRESVRCEYFDSLDAYFTQGTGAFGTMYRTERHKLCVYHGYGTGQLFDLEADPGEHRNLWDDPDSLAFKSELLLAAFDDHVLKNTDVGAERIAPM